MNLKKIAMRGLVAMAIIVTICMFFSGTIKTITTAKVKIIHAKTGYLEERTELSGKLIFPDVEHIYLSMEHGQVVQITGVHSRPGYIVREGDVIIEAKVVDYESIINTYQASYDDMLDQLLILENKNRNLRIRRSDEIYAEAYFKLLSLQKEIMADRILIEGLLAREGLILPDDGIPEGASEELTEMIFSYHTKEQEEVKAEDLLNSVARYLPDEVTWTYISSRYELEEKMADIEQRMQELSQLNGRAREIKAPLDGYVVDVMVKVGDTYDGSLDLFTVNKEGKLPILRVDISSVKKAVTEGMDVEMPTSNYGVIKTKVLKTGLDSDGKRYADVEINEEMIDAGGGIYAMIMKEIPLELINHANQESSLLSVNAVHGSDDNQYIYILDTYYSSFGSSTMKVRKMDVTVLAEANGLVSIEENLINYDIAYMEDRPINDGDVVMLYTE